MGKPSRRKWPAWRRCLRLCAEVVKIEKVRCVRCGQTLLLAEYVKGEIKCPRCKTINRLDIKMTEPRAAPKE
ncbi:Com family DNA-binding transcriptional regulator [Enterocloster bolteae]|uniref:Com family DNA-binding transcriptional regulator n=1 Tax=Enterocloster TaxID=2719313 RepID=UPI00148D6708|nr:Com family DNA-binding transcriptional regulator [Enterocloster bolteae]MBT9827401.1 Com family DNA-binding transcriptional regulator [Enterocloster bolteae]QJU21400.1 Com family DNA-binding transcriptional regulator [Enterocloster bolteae]